MSNILTFCNFVFLPIYASIYFKWRQSLTVGKKIRFVQSMYVVQSNYELFSKQCLYVFKIWKKNDYLIIFCVNCCISPKSQTKNDGCLSAKFFQSKVHIFWEGHKFLRNLHCRFVLCSNGQIYYGDFAKFCGLLRIYELD